MYKYSYWTDLAGGTSGMNIPWPAPEAPIDTLCAVSLSPTADPWTMTRVVLKWEFGVRVTSQTQQIPSGWQARTVVQAVVGYWFDGGVRYVPTMGENNQDILGQTLLTPAPFYDGSAAHNSGCTWYTSQELDLKGQRKTQVEGGQSQVAATITPFNFDGVGQALIQGPTYWYTQVVGRVLWRGNYPPPVG